MDKLIITNCATDTSMYPEVPQRFEKSEALIQSIEPAYKAGAAIVHIHAPPNDFQAWESHTKAIREKCDVMIQYGISIQTVEQRKAVIKFQPDMISVALGAHNLAFSGRDLMMLHPRAELEDLMRLCNDHAVKPEFEIVSLGDIWLLRDLIEKGLVKPPYFLTLFFGRPGGSWSPATINEFINRVSGLPEDSIYTISVTGPSHLLLETMATMSGGHVRVGTEDEPYLRSGVLGDNVDHVARIALIAKEFGRGVASVSEAREMLKMPKR